MLPFRTLILYNLGVRILVTLVLALIISARAHAADGSADKKARAKELYEEAKINYRAGDLDRAAEEFKESFKLYPRPETLFNLAQTHRLLKNYEKAVFFYQQYLSLAGDTLDDGARKTVRDRIGELQTLVKQQQAAQNAPPQGPEPSALSERTSTQTTPPPTAVTPPPTAVPVTATSVVIPPPHHRYGRAAVALGSVGVIVVGAGAGLLGYASTLQPSPDATLGDVQKQDDERHSLRISGGVLVGVGAAALIGGAVYLGLHLKGRHQ